MPSETRKIALRTGAEVEIMVGGTAGAAPPLVLVPGVAGAKELFSPVFDLLGADRRVIATDLSPVVAHGSTLLSSAVDDFLQVLDALDVPRCDLLGQSFGALIAVRALKARPAAVRRLVLAGPATIPSSWAAPGIFWRWTIAGGVMRFCPIRLRPWVAGMIRRTGGFALEPELDGTGFDELMTRVRSTHVRPLIRRLLAVRGHPWKKEMEGVEVPVLVIEGDREAALLPSAVITFFDERPNTTYREIPGGHLPFLVRPKEFVGCVTTFLADATRDSLAPYA